MHYIIHSENLVRFELIVNGKKSSVDLAPGLTDDQIIKQMLMITGIKNYKGINVINRYANRKIYVQL